MPVVEHIPDSDRLARLISFPTHYNDVRELIWEKVFEFPKGVPESLCWEKYAEIPNGMHTLGLEREQFKRNTNPNFVYEGFIETLSESLRGIKTAKGHGFLVVHHPDEGNHHVHISYDPNPNDEFTKTKRSELRLALKMVFSELRAYERD